MNWHIPQLYFELQFDVHIRLHWSSHEPLALTDCTVELILQHKVDRYSNNLKKEQWDCIA